MLCVDSSGDPIILEYKINPDIERAITIDFNQIMHAAKSKWYIPYLLSIDNQEGVNYIKKELRYRRQVFCPVCEGTLLTPQSEILYCGKFFLVYFNQVHEEETEN